MVASRTKRRLQALWFTALLAFISTGAVRGQTSYNSVMDVLNDPSQGLTSFKQLVQAAGMEQTLSNTSFSGTGFIPADTALLSFAQANNFSDIGALAAVDKSALQKFVKFHFLSERVPSSFIGSLASNASDISGTLLSVDYLSPPAFTKIGCNQTAAGGGYQVFGSSGSPAQIVKQDISVDNGKSYIHVIDGVLSYWYKDLSTASSSLGVRAFYDSLVIADQIYNNNLINETATRVYFAPTDVALNNFSQAWGFDLTSPNVSKTAVLDILANHATYFPVDDLPQANGTTHSCVTFSSQYSGANGNYLTVTTFATPVVTGNITKQTKVYYNISGISNYALALAGTGRVPVGGIVPSSFVYVIDTVLLPVYTSIWQYLMQQDTPASYTNIIGFLRAEGSVIQTLQNPATASTFLAPLDTGVRDFLRDHGGASNLSLTFPTAASQKTVLQTHILVESLNQSMLLRNATRKTAAGQDMTTVVGAALRGQPTLYAGQTNATVYSTVKEAPILYGRSYVQTINYVLVPKGVNLPGGGSAASTLPSLLLLAVAVVLGRMVLAATA